MRNKRWTIRECNLLVTFQRGLCQRVTRYGDQSENQNPAKEIHYVVLAHRQLASVKCREGLIWPKQLFTSALIGQYSCAHARETIVRGRCIVVNEFYSFIFTVI